MLNSYRDSLAKTIYNSVLSRPAYQLPGNLGLNEYSASVSGLKDPPNIQRLWCDAHVVIN